MATGRLEPYDLGPARRGATCASPGPDSRRCHRGSHCGRGQVALSLGDWVAVTPPRVPELRTVQEYVGSTDPVLMDWAVGLAFLPAADTAFNGVTQVPKFRITRITWAANQDTDTWEDGRNGGLLGISDLLLRAHVMATTVP